MFSLVFFQQLSRRLFLLAALLSLSGFYLAYLYADAHTLGAQVAGHLLLLLGPSLLKFGYVIQLASEEAAKPARSEAAGSARTIRTH